MKFTKDDARKELVTLMTAKGEKLNLSERSFNEQLDQLMPLLANDETELNDFVSKVLPLFKTADANVRNDVSVSINEFKKQNPTVAKTAQEEPKKEVDEELVKRLAALEDKLKQTEEQERVANIRKQVVEKVKEKGVKDTEWISSILNDVTITEDFDVNSRAESYVNIYNKMLAGYDPNATSRSAGGGKGKNTVQDVIKQAAEKQKQQQSVFNV